MKLIQLNDSNKTIDVTPGLKTFPVDYGWILK